MPPLLENILNTFRQRTNTLVFLTQQLLDVRDANQTDSWEIFKTKLTFSPSISTLKVFVVVKIEWVH